MTSLYVVRYPYLSNEIEIKFVRNLNITSFVKKFEEIINGLIAVAQKNK